MSFIPKPRGHIKVLYLYFHSHWVSKSQMSLCVLKLYPAETFDELPRKPWPLSAAYAKTGTYFQNVQLNAWEIDNNLKGCHYMH